MEVFFKQIGHPRPLFVYFRLFKQTLQFLQQMNVRNIHPVYGAGNRTHDLRNKHEYPPITTRPGLLNTQHEIFRGEGEHIG